MKNKAAEDMQQYAKKCVKMKYQQQQKQTMKYANSNKHSMSLKRSNRKKEENP